MGTSETPVRAKAKKHSTATATGKVPATRPLALIGDCEPENLESLRKGVQLAIESAMLKIQRELSELEGVGQDSRRLRVCGRDLRSAWNLIDALRNEIKMLQREVEIGTRPSTRLVLVKGGAT